MGADSDNVTPSAVAGMVQAAAAVVWESPSGWVPPVRVARVGDSEGRSGSAGEPTVDDPDSEKAGRLWKRTILSLTAAGWYLSLLIHMVGYTAAALIFWLMGLSLLSDSLYERLPAIRAALDDFDREDEDPVLEIIQTSRLNPNETTSSRQQLASYLDAIDDGQIDTIRTDALASVTGSQDQDSGAVGQSVFFRIPKSGLAVTKGSFTAWTEPANPGPGELYQIIIEIRLPGKMKRYRVSDLSGQVIGTDRYRQKIPYDSRAASATRVTAGGKPVTVNSRTVVDVTGDKVQLVIKVPGARRLVKDTIRIRSRRLREEHDLVLVFGGSASQDGDSALTDDPKLNDE